jgi:acyl-CoA reductase-like NAD-dependent aldehyde dehydrogenase
MQQELISNVVQEVLRRMGGPGGNGQTGVAPAVGQPAVGHPAAASPSTGLFSEVEPAVSAAQRAQQQLAQAGVTVRAKICALFKQIASDNADAWGRYELEETKVGRLDHKVAKLRLLDSVPGVEFLETAAHSGDGGISLDEAAPWGVIGVITPVTHSIPTMTANAISMIAAGNSMVVNPHPSGARSAALAAETYNNAIRERFGIDPLICLINPPTLKTAEQIFRHERIPLLVATGGPAVARAAMKQPKRAVVAGPGNPPVVVDQTADLDHAADSIITGGAFDNNLLCIGEKEVFVVDSVFTDMMAAMRRAGAFEINPQQVASLTEAALERHKDHWIARRQFVGAGASVLAEAAGTSCGGDVDLLFGETAADNPFVPTEQMMPFIPFVRVRDFDHALKLALENEHGFGHTAIIHSNNLANITRMGQTMNTTIFVVNGPCTAGLGVGGEGYPSFSIATPSGEGITTPLTFTRFRRCSLSQSLRIV